MPRACSYKTEYLDDLINGLLDAEKEAIVLSHLENCNECRSHYNDMMSIRKAMGRINVKAPEGLADDIMRAVRESAVIETEVKPKRMPGPVYIASYAVAACLVLALGFIFFDNLFLTGNTMKESAEMFANEEQGMADDTQRNSPGSNYITATEGEADLAPSPVPAPDKAFGPESVEPGFTADMLMDRGFEFNTSAFAGSNSMTVNDGGTNLEEAYGYEGSQDILYATANYSAGDIAAILLKEFGVRATEQGDNYVLADIPSETVTALEQRLDLVASAQISDELKSYTIRILSLSGE